MNTATTRDFASDAVCNNLSEPTTMITGLQFWDLAFQVGRKTFSNLLTASHTVSAMILPLPVLAHHKCSIM